MTDELRAAFGRPFFLEKTLVRHCILCNALRFPGDTLLLLVISYVRSLNVPRK
jgi:hypothetical protein